MIEEEGSGAGAPGESGIDAKINQFIQERPDLYGYC